MNKSLFLLIFAAIYSSNVHSTIEEILPDKYPEVYNIEPLPTFIHGWGRYKFYFDPLLKRKKIQTAVEIGCWFGNWTIYIAKQLDEGSKLYAVDHWEGSIEHKKSAYKTWLPTIFQQFLSNMINENLQKKVIPVRLDSIEASKIFKENGIKFDLIYIDASHDYNSVKKDLEAWYPLLAEEGIFCGDDWQGQGVSRAVKEFSKKIGKPVYPKGNFWTFEKPNE